LPPPHNTLPLLPSKKLKNCRIHRELSSNWIGEAGRGGGGEGGVKGAGTR